MKMKKTKQQVILQDVEIIDAAAEGKAIAKVDGLVIFVPFAVPGDIVDILLLKKKKSYAEGRVVAYKKLSDKRAPLQCPHFGTCGGCKWQNMQYAEQLKYKQQQVKDNLERLGGLDTSMMRPICGSENIFYYRNKLEFTFSNRRWKTPEEIAEGKPIEDEQGALGFHIPAIFDKALNIEHCALQSEPSNQIRLAIRDYAYEHKLEFYDIRNHTGFLRNLMIRNTTIGEWMVVLIVAEMRDELFPLLDFVAEKFPQITSLQYIVNNKMNDIL